MNLSGTAWKCRRDPVPLPNSSYSIFHDLPRAVVLAAKATHLYTEKVPNLELVDIWYSELLIYFSHRRGEGRIHSQRAVGLPTVLSALNRLPVVGCCWHPALLICEWVPSVSADWHRMATCRKEMGSRMKVFSGWGFFFWKCQGLNSGFWDWASYCQSRKELHPKSCACHAYLFPFTIISFKWSLARTFLIPPPEANPSNGVGWEKRMGCRGGPELTQGQWGRVGIRRFHGGEGAVILHNETIYVNNSLTMSLSFVDTICIAILESSIYETIQNFHNLKTLCTAL